MAVMVEKYSPRRSESVITILADAFVTNPLLVSAFGRHSIEHSRLFFRFGLRNMFKGEAFVALVDGEVCGYIHFISSPGCLPAAEEIPAVMANLLNLIGDAKPRVIEWFARWCRLDPDAPHLHLGPIGVSPEMQSRRVGTALMSRYIERLEHDKIAGYLETDRPENVKFYEKFGFQVAREEELIGTPTWYMWRRKE
jgi:ribosomal protein S18 acetylase RimI-like enzyme